MRRKVRRVRQDSWRSLVGFGSSLCSSPGEDSAGEIGIESGRDSLEIGSTAVFSTSSVGAEMAICGGVCRRCCCSVCCF